MPPQTRARYIAVEVQARSAEPGARVKREATLRWNRWTRAEKAEFITRLDAVEHRTQARDAIQDEPNLEIARWHTVLNAGQAERYITTLNAVYRTVRESQRADYDLQEAYTDLARFYRQHECPQAIIDTVQAAWIRQNNIVITNRSRVAHWRREHNRFATAGRLPRQQFKVLPGMSNAAASERLLKGLQLVRAHREADDNLIWSVFDFYPEAAMLPLGPQGPMPLYFNDFGEVVVSAWRLNNEQRQCVKSLVRKDVLMIHCWSDHNKWTGDVRNPATRVWSEGHIHETVYQARSHPVQGRSNILPMIHHGVDNVTRIFTLWTEMAVYGNLNELNTAWFNRHVQQPGRHRYPEAFIWYVALSLVEAGLTMLRGNVDLDTPPVQDWTEIVHLDIKPPNIFLTTPDPTRFPGYPQPQLGDFGIAIQTYPGDPANPEAYPESGTPRWTAPEQTLWRDQHYKSHSRYELSSKTDVFLVGLNLHKMMRLGHLAEAVVDAAPSTPNYHVPSDHGADPAFYSPELNALVAECLRTAPDDRASFEELHGSIMRVLEDAPEVSPAIQTVRDIYTGRIDVFQQQQHSVLTHGLPGALFLQEDQWSLLPWHQGDERFRIGSLMQPSGAIGGDLNAMAFGGMTLAGRGVIGRVGYQNSWSYGL